MYPADPEVLPEADSLLGQFLSQNDKELTETLLNRLLTEHAQPLVRRVVGSKLQRKEERRDADDVCHEVLLQLTRWLRGLKGAKDSSITSFCGYVVTTAQNACSRYLREKHPVRWRLKNKLRYLLSHRPEFRTLEDDRGHLFCWLKNRLRPGALDPPAGKLMQMDIDAFLSLHSAIVAEASGVPTPALVEALLFSLDTPIYLDDLTALIGQALRIDFHPLAEQDGPGDAAAGLEDLRDHSPSITEKLSQSRYLVVLWEEIRCLPLKQRLALLLNLRESGQASALSLFVETGVVSLRQIAEVLEFQLDAFTVLWNQLPLDDNAVGTLLGITRQQVINLRKSARDRLGRRMHL